MNWHALGSIHGRSATTLGLTVANLVRGDRGRRPAACTLEPGLARAAGRACVRRTVVEDLPAQQAGVGDDLVHELPLADREATVLELHLGQAARMINSTQLIGPGRPIVSRSQTESELWVHIASASLSHEAADIAWLRAA
jgi:hypothetical protein